MIKLSEHAKMQIEEQEFALWHDKILQELWDFLEEHDAPGLLVEALHHAIEENNDRIDEDYLRLIRKYRTA